MYVFVKKVNLRSIVVTKLKSSKFENIFLKSTRFKISFLAVTEPLKLACANSL